MKKVLIPLILTSLLLLTIAYAQDYSFSVDLPEEIWAGEEHTLNLTVTNNGPTQWFSISVFGDPIDWVRTESSSIKVESGESKTIEAYVFPSRDAVPGTYSYDFSVAGVTTDDKVSDLVLISVKQSSPLVIKEFSLSCTDCKGNTVTVSGTVENIGSREVDSGMSVRLGSEQITIKIGPLLKAETKYFEHTFSLGNSEPGNYEIEGKIIDSDDMLVYSDKIRFSIPTIENIVYDKSVTTTPFGTFVSLTGENRGNSPATAEFSSDVVNQWFVFFSGPQPDDIIGNEYSWSIPVDESNIATISYSEVYWPVPLFVIIIIVVALYFYLKSTAILVRKKVNIKRAVKSGEEVTVTIGIRNRLQEMEGVVARDFLPKSFSVVGSFHTLKPTLKKSDKGTELIFKIGRLRVGEERLITYRIKASKDVKGFLRLPSVYVRAKIGEKMVMHRSNPVGVSGESTTPDVLRVEIAK